MSTFPATAGTLNEGNTMQPTPGASAPAVLSAQPAPSPLDHRASTRPFTRCCAWCKSIWTGESWITERRDLTQVAYTHGICRECQEQQFQEALAPKRKRARGTGAQRGLGVIDWPWAPI